MAAKKVLVIDDDVESLREMKDILNSSGYNPITVGNSDIALIVAQKTKPDVILTGIKMKGLNGFQVADRLNRHAETSDIPVIAVSGHFVKAEHKRLMSMLGIKALIRKPFNPLDVISRIEIFS